MNIFILFYIYGNAEGETKRSHLRKMSPFSSTLGKFHSFNHVFVFVTDVILFVAVSLLFDVF